MIKENSLRSRLNNETAEKMTETQFDQEELLTLPTMQELEQEVLPLDETGVPADELAEDEMIIAARGKIQAEWLKEQEQAIRHSARATLNSYLPTQDELLQAHQY